MYIMEKGDKPKRAKPDGLKAVPKVDPKAKKVKPDGLKPKAKKVIKQKQSQKQTVKVVIGEQAKPKRKYARKPKQALKQIIGYRGTTAVSYLGGEGDVNQVITPIRAPQKAPQAPQAPQPPLLSATQAPATLDTELTARSELIYPKARTPAFQEVQEEVPKKKTQAKAKSTLFKIGEGIGDFLKRNLLDQPADLNLQEPSRDVEEARAPLEIRPESYPVKPKPKPKPKQTEGKTEVPVTILLSERQKMGMEDVDVPEVIKVKPESLKPKVKVKTGGKGKTEVPVNIVLSERQGMGMEDVNVAAKEAPKPVEYEQKAEPLSQDQQDAIKEKEDMMKRILSKPYKEKEEDITVVKEYLKKQREKMEAELAVKDTMNEMLSKLEDQPTKVASIQDAPIDKQVENMLQSVEPIDRSRLIAADTINDIISTIETPIFSSNPDFKAISQNVDVENVPSSELDFGNTDITQFNVDGFTPVGTVQGMVEAIERKQRGRPAKYSTEEERKAAKRAQTLESNRRKAEERKRQEEEAALKNIMITERQPSLLGVVTGKDLPSIFFPKIEKAYDADFQSGDFQQQIGDLGKTNNFASLNVGQNDELGYSDEDPSLTVNLFNPDPVGSDLPSSIENVGQFTFI